MTHVPPVNSDGSGPPEELLGQLLDNVRLSEYYGPPSTLDEAIAEAIVAMAGGPPEEWQSFVASLTEPQRRVLGRFALRAPMVALRTENSGRLYAGLLAHCAIRQEVADWRDDLVVFAPFFHVARALDMDIPKLFDRAAVHAVPDLAHAMQVFGRRTDVTLGAFGWRQIDTPDGPTFESMSMRGSPTGAVVGERSWDEVNKAQAEAILRWVEEQRRRHGSSA